MHGAEHEMETDLGDSPERGENGEHGAGRREWGDVTSQGRRGGRSFRTYGVCWRGYRLLGWACEIGPPVSAE